MKNFIKQLNNIEVPEDETSVNYIQISNLKGSIDDKSKQEYYDRIKQTPNKKFYFGMEFKKINNPEFNNPLLYPLKTMPLNKQFYTPQINKISMHMPSSPPLTQYNDLPKASDVRMNIFCLMFNFMAIVCLRICYVMKIILNQYVLQIQLSFVRVFT